MRAFCYTVYMMNPTLTRTAKHFRKRLAVAGVKAKCSALVSCGVQMIRVNVPSYKLEFSDADQAQILLIASCNHLTLSRGQAIDLSQRTYTKTAVFELSNEVS